MSVEITLPELGESVEGGLLVAWLVAVGDEVTEGQAIAEVSTDKVDTEVPSPRSGTVIRLVAEIDAEVHVGGVLLELAPSGSAAVPEMSGAPAPASPPAAAPAPEPAPAATPVRATPAPPPADATGLRLSPLVRRMVRERGLDPRALIGTGPDGRVTADDVVAGDSGERTAAPRLAPPRVHADAGSGTRTEPLSRMRRVIAQRMYESVTTTAQLTSAVEVDVSRIMALRSRVREAARARHGVSLSPLAFLAHATIRALALHPQLNGSIDMERGTMTLHSGVNLGIAVDAPTGLMVPVIRDAQELGPVALQRRIADLAERARTRRITPDDLSGGTFTITNTGSRGSLFDTPILNPPEVGILATPAIEKRPVVVTDPDGRDRIANRYRTYLCLTYDHRLVDGADAARFLADLSRLADSDDWGPEVAELVG